MKFCESLAVLGVFCSTAAITNAQPTRTFTVEGEIQTSEVWRTPPSGSAGFVVGHRGDSTAAPVFFTIDRTGRRDEFLFTYDDATGMIVDDYSIAPNGEIAVVGGAYTSDGRWASFVARISPDRKRRTATRVWPYCPIVVTIAADGSLWTIGRLKNEEGTRDLAEPLLRRYGGSGALLSSAKVQVRREYYTLGATYLTASRNRVGWLTTTRGPAIPGEYIEFDLDGKEIGRYAGPQGVTYAKITGVALSEDNDLIAGIIDGGMRKLVALDRPSNSWIPVSLPEKPAPVWRWVLGFDGSTLVTTAEDGKLRRFKTK